ncbi:hypothetical protein E2C01_101142 [Portunus trituberculatus]|uniref:Uncharacterized protein n=1 Tax=Portunus trituberculatus TaxID=210409 RepID=A0A5B7K4Y5_PORTR|nr:hypothetical protein [Portunus trituberculatus]
MRITDKLNLKHQVQAKEAGFKYAPGNFNFSNTTLPKPLRLHKPALLPLRFLNILDIHQKCFQKSQLL